MSDKPAFVRQLPRLTPAKINEITTAYRREAESLLAVDEMVGRMYDALQESGELDNTIFVFASDNGFSHGEHRWPTGKVRVYDEAVRVPLIVRGPGFAADRQVTDPVINVDLAPTLVERSGATPGRVMDGRSLRDRDRSRPILFEAQHSINPYFGVQSGRWVWVEYTNGEKELYDMIADPYQLASRHKDPESHEPPQGPRGPPRRAEDLHRGQLSHSVNGVSGGCRRTRQAPEPVRSGVRDR